MTNVHQVVGPPGTGKTTYLASQAKESAVKYGTKNVLISSLTRAAAFEIGGRDTAVVPEMVGTLHAHAFKALGRPVIAETKVAEWNERHPQYEITSGRKGGVDDPMDQESGIGDGDVMLSDVNNLRAALVPTNKWRLIQRDFHSKWEEWKEDNGYLDFTDLIERCLTDTEKAPGDPMSMIGDEAQDWSPMEVKLFRDHWGAHASEVVMAGDGDQCHPAGTMIKRRGGADSPIEDIAVGDRLVMPYKGQINGIRNGVGCVVERAVRKEYRGPIIKIETESGKSHECTYDHKCLVKLSNLKGLYCVYIMRRGDNFRVGASAMEYKTYKKYNRENGSIGPFFRMKCEKADSIWILELFKSREEAFVYENLISARFSIPQVLFACSSKSDKFGQSYLDKFWDSLGSNLKDASICLNAHGRFLDSPLARNERGKNTLGYRSFITNAANVMPSIMSVRVVASGKKTEWSIITSADRRHHSGYVYGISVSPGESNHRLYVANDIVTHNCLYGWRGADPNIFLDHPVPSGQKKVLSQSWRVPKAVHDAAHSWIRQVSRREDIDYLPTADDGDFRYIECSFKNTDPLIDSVRDRVAAGETCMILASCSFLLKPVLSALRSEGLPFHNPYRRAQAAWNPLQRRKDSVMAADRLLAYLAPVIESGRDPVKQWLPEEFELWVSQLKTGDVVRRGVKKEMTGKGDFRFMPNMNLGSYRHYFSDFESHHEATMSCDLDWFESAVMDSKRKPLQYPIDLVRKSGHGVLLETPKIVVGTIHSVKGGECDNVYVFPDLSPAGIREWSDQSEGRDSIIRMFYVAMTRARKRLFLCDRGSGYAVDWR